MPKVGNTSYPYTPAGKAQAKAAAKKQGIPVVDKPEYPGDKADTSKVAKAEAKKPAPFSGAAKPFAKKK